VAREGRRLRGSVRVEESDTLELRVRLPPDAATVAAFANGRAVPHRVRRGFAVFALRAVAGKPADWAVTW
jgi:hypothetical protein